MYVQILKIDEEIFSGYTKCVTLPGKEGIFQILNFHSPIISILIYGEVVIKIDNSKKYNITPKIDSKNIKVSNNQVIYIIHGGIIEMHDNKIIILCD